MSLLKTIFSATALLSFSLFAYANNTIETKLEGLGVKVDTIEDSPIKGIKTVTSDQGMMLISEDGNFLFHGDLYDLTSGKPVNYMVSRLVKEMEKISHEMIIYPAKNEQFVVTIFTDITCPYCQKLHQQMSEYNELGITIRYLAFPRQGPSSENAKNMQSVWCMADKNKAFDLADKGEMPAPATCDIDITQHYNLGHQMGVTGTPAIVTPNGNLVPGYMPPKDMLEMLKNQQ